MTRQRTLAAIAFVLLSCGLAWLVALPLWLGDGLASPLVGVVLPVLMFTPAIAVLIVMFAFGFPTKGERLRFLGIWPLRPAKRVVGLSILSLVAPPVLVLLAVGIAALFGWVELDLVGLSGLTANLAAAAPEGTPVPPTGVILIVQLLTIPIAGATINAVLAFGEELGWRGFLVPALRPLGTWPTLLISGVAWGLWHSPIILLGYNFGRPDLVGVLLMVAGCVAWGVLLGWLRLRSASVWPAVFAHGALNAAGGMVALVYAAGTTFDMGLVGPLGVASWIVLALVVVVLAVTGQFSRQPELADAPGRLLSRPRGQ